MTPTEENVREVVQTRAENRRHLDQGRWFDLAMQYVNRPNHPARTAPQAVEWALQVLEYEHNQLHGDEET